MLPRAIQKGVSNVKVLFDHGVAVLHATAWNGLAVTDTATKETFWPLSDYLQYCQIIRPPLPATYLPLKLIHKEFSGFII